MSVQMQSKTIVNRILNANTYRSGNSIPPLLEVVALQSFTRNIRAQASYRPAEEDRNTDPM